MNGNKAGCMRSAAVQGDRSCVIDCTSCAARADCLQRGDHSYTMAVRGLASCSPALSYLWWALMIVPMTLCDQQGRSSCASLDGKVRLVDLGSGVHGKPTILVCRHLQTHALRCRQCLCRAEDLSFPSSRPPQQALQVSMRCHDLVACRHAMDSVLASQ